MFSYGVFFLLIKLELDIDFSGWQLCIRKNWFFGQVKEKMGRVLPSNLYTSSALNDSLRSTILQIQVIYVNYMKGTVICPL